MKTIRLMVCFIGFLCLLASCFSTKTVAGKVDKYAWIMQQVDSGKFKIEVNQAYPLSGPVVNLTTIYTLEVRNDSVISRLPYFGRAYVAPMDPTQGGLQFESPCIGYKKEYSTKKGYKISFSAKTREDHYRFFVEISTEGYSGIGVTSDKRSFIRFAGQMVK